MHARDLVELGALVAAHAPLLLRNEPLTWENGLLRYWAASRRRLDRWGHALHAYRAAASQGSHDGGGWQTIRPLLEEVLASELLTRVWTAVATACDQRFGADEIAPVVRSIYVGHLGARRRVLDLMVYGSGFSVEEAVALNRLRRRTERWTDMLLGRVMLQHDVLEFAFDANRVRDFAGGMSAGNGPPDDPSQWRIILASLRAAFQPGPSHSSLNADLNEEIASSILSLFRENLFDSTGLPKSLWLERLYAATNDTQAMIEQLIAMDQSPPPPAEPAATSSWKTRRFLR